MSDDDFAVSRGVCGHVCPENPMVYCVHPPGHDGCHAGLNVGLNEIRGALHRWPTAGDVPLADWDGLGWFRDPEPLPERVNPVVVVVLVGALIVTVLLAAAVAVALGGVL